MIIWSENPTLPRDRPSAARTTSSAASNSNSADATRSSNTPAICLSKTCRLGRAPKRVPRLPLCTQSLGSYSRDFPEVRVRRWPARNRRLQGNAPGHWYRERSPSTCSAGDRFLHLFKRHSRSFVLQPAKHSRNGFQGQYSNFLVFKNYVSDSVARRYSECFANLFRQCGLTFGSYRRLNH